MARASAAERLGNGFRFRFAPAADIIATIAAVLDDERKCCRFLQFQMIAEADEGPVWLEVTGPPGTCEFLAGWVPPA
jgi:hypothetical protein